MLSGMGKEQMQHPRVIRLTKRMKREAKKEEEDLPKELVARVDMSEEQPEKVNNSDSDTSKDSEDEDCEITDSEEQRQYICS